MENHSFLPGEIPGQPTNSRVEQIAPADKPPAAPLSESFIDYMKDGVTSLWNNSPKAWSDIFHGTASQYDYGLALTDVGLGMGAAGIAAVAAEPAMIAAGVVAGESVLDALSIGGIVGTISGAVTALGGEALTIEGWANGDRSQ